MYDYDSRELDLVSTHSYSINPLEADWVLMGDTLKGLIGRSLKNKLYQQKQKQDRLSKWIFDNCLSRPRINASSYHDQYDRVIYNN